MCKTKDWGQNTTLLLQYSLTFTKLLINNLITNLKFFKMEAVILVYIAIIVLMIASIWVIFNKAGKPGWASIIPIYNIIVMLEVVGKPWWWLLLMMFVPIVNVVFAIWMINLLSKSFGKGVGYTLGLLFLSIIFYPILAFGSAKYVGPAGK